MSEITPAAAPGDAIHDIGFRHYDGPRLSRDWIFRSLVIETLRGAFGLGRPARAKAMPVVLLGMLVAFAVVLLIILFLGVTAVLGGEPGLEVSYTQFPGNASILITLFVASRAPYAVSRDLRAGVLPLYLSRPLKRADYVWAKLAGLSLATFILLAIPLTVMYLGALLGKLSFGGQTLEWLGGLLMAALLAILLSSIALTIASVTLKRGMGIAAIVSALILIKGLALSVAVIVSEQVSESSGFFYQLLDPYAVVNSLGVSWLGAATGDEFLAPSGFTAGLAATLVFLVMTSGSVALLLRRFRKVGGV